VLVAGNDVAIHGLGDVVEPEHQVILRDDGFRPLDAVGVLEQGDDVQRAGFLHGRMQTGEGTNVNHWNRRSIC